jgi:hypothetical protein
MVLLIVGLSASAAAAGPGDMPSPREGPEDARGRAADILARPEFRPEPRSVVERVLDKLGELLGRIVGDVGGGNPGLAWAAVAAVALLLAAVLWRAVRALQVDVGSASGVSVDGRRRPPADWRAEADGHAAAGRWRDALRCSWRAVVADLAALGLVEEVPGRTTGEYQARVARTVPSGAEHFSRATRLFEDAWYATVEVGQEEAAQVRALGDRVLAEARRRM